MSARPHLALLAALLVAGGCALVDAPAGYAALDDPPRPYAFQAVSPDDCRFAVRTVANEGGADLRFWADAIANQLVRRKGYTLVAAEDLTTDRGVAGRVLLFSTSAKGVEYRYLVGVFPYRSLFGSGIRVVEAAGEAAAFEKDRTALGQAIRSLR